MAVEITMPQLSDTMDSGKILSWSKQEGQEIKRGDILAEVETDKANLEIESFHNGVLLKIVTPQDSTANVGEVIAYIGEAGEALPSSSSTADSGKLSDNSSNSDTPPKKEAEQKANSSSQATAQDSNITQRPTASANGNQFTADDRVKASPLARKLASEQGITLSSISGTGPGGRIVKKDIQEVKAPESVVKNERTESTTTNVSSVTGSGNMVPFSKMRATIASRMQQSVTEAPHFYVTTSIRMDAAMNLRQTLKEKPGFEVISINHLVIKAAAMGIAAEPRVNYCVRDEQFVYQPPEINVGIITAIDDGLLIPVLKSADKMTIKDIVFEARAAVERARAGRPSSQDLVGGTFSISNMGMFDVESFTAIINPGQGSVLAVSSILDQPVVQNGALVAGKVMKATISVDHRIIDGVMAGNFMKAFKEALENPALLFI
jgi:pyruvate dehydrogenase E2 component (dihydrolipoamide acetyltransferase)